MVSADDMQTVVEEYATRMIRLAYMYVKNHADAEDIVQDAFVAYMTHCPALFYVEDYSVSEIGALLKVNPSTVRTWPERGRRELKEKYGDEIYE